MALQGQTAVQPRILVIDDEGDIRDVLQGILESEGYAVRMAADGQEGLRAFFDWRPSRVIMDIKMPKMNGWELLDRIRQVSDVPVIVLTAMDQEYDTVRGLQLGADEYVTKPVRHAEMAARVNAMFRRSKGAPDLPDVYSDGAIWVDFSRHTVYVEGKEVALSPLEFRLLAAFVRSPGVVLSTDQLLDRCWGEGTGGAESVRIYIGYLRKKLNDDARRPKRIETVREFGYRYRPEPSEDDHELHDRHTLRK